MSDAPFVVISVVNWNNYDDTKECIESLERLDYPNSRVVLVDNGSTDDSTTRIEAEHPDLDVIYTGENLGYAGGMNVGSRKALEWDADYVWQLNNDVIVPDEDLLSSLVETMEDHPEIGMLTPLVKEYPNMDEVWFWRGYIDWKRGNTNHYDFEGEPTEQLVHNDYIPNCSLLFPAHVLREAGHLPEEYFLYFDDVEHAVRVAECGYDLVTDMSTEIYHKESKSSLGALGPMFSYYRSRNTLLFADRFSEYVSPLFPLYFSWWLLQHIGFRLYYRRPAGIRGLFEGVVDGLRSVDGRGKYP